MVNGETIFFDRNYKHYLIQYIEKLGNDYSNDEKIYFTVIDEKNAIMSVPRDINGLLIRKNMPFITYINRPCLYTLQKDINPIESANIKSLQIKDAPLNLTGLGVVVAIIDTGIDYTNPIFINSKGESRIKLLWDQTLKKKVKNNKLEEFMPFGELFSRDEINNALGVKTQGGDPYTIVPSKDDIGHGTEMASIIGGAHKDKSLESVVPEVEFIIIKLMQDVTYEEIYNSEVPVFNITSVVCALNFLYKYLLSNTVPMVIYIPLGTNFANHKGNGVIEEFINRLTLQNGVAVVTGTGNEANKGGHSSGVISKYDIYKDVQIFIAENQNVLQLEIWSEKPNIVNIDIISPSGETTGIINSSINESQTYKFIYEKTKVEVIYFSPEGFSGDQLVLVLMKDIQPGTWIFRLYGRQILDGKFNVWIPQNGIAKDETRFISPDPYGTVTSPGLSSYIITVANYNQNNNNIVNSSGMALLKDSINNIDLAAGGINMLTIDNNGEKKLVSGTSVSSAIVTGVCAMILQWGIIEGNDPLMYSKKIKAYLARGISKRSGDIYPNVEWGYGMLNVAEIFRNLY